MSIGWVAGSVRAEAMLKRRLGPAGARAVAGAKSLPDALTVLAGTPYNHDIRPGQALTEAEHAIGATVLWHMRVLAGWQPRPRGEIVRILAGGFEISNVDNLVRRSGAAYRLGSLSTAWQSLAGAGSPGEIRGILAGTAWGDPGTSSPAAIGLAMRLAWADRVIGGVPDAARWAAGAAALLVARELFALGRRLEGPVAARASAILGPVPVSSAALPDYVRELPESAQWALADVHEPQELWRAEAGWWTQVERDGFDLMRRARFDSRAVVGAIAVLAADAWRVRAALQLAARGGHPLEVFDAIA